MKKVNESKKLSYIKFKTEKNFFLIKINYLLTL